MSYKLLTVFQKSNQLVLEIYKVTQKYPRSEIFGLVSQMRRAAVSVPANIVEGYGRNTFQYKLHFCYISRASLKELEYYIDLSLDLKYINTSEHQLLINLQIETSKLLTAFIKYLRNHSIS